MALGLEAHSICELSRNACSRAPSQPESESGHRPAQSTLGSRGEEEATRMPDEATVNKECKHGVVYFDLCSQDEVQTYSSLYLYNLRSK